MKKALISATLLTAPLAFSATPIDGFYSSVFGGYSYLPNNISTTRGGLVRTDANMKASSLT